MKKHIILEKSFVYDAPTKNELPQDSTFDENSGYWRDNITGEPMMTCINARKPRSKKADIETGEDQKGE